jgi:ribosomal protein S12 methylthiotransferase
MTGHKTAAIITQQLCGRRSLEWDRLQRYLTANGWVLQDHPAGADTLFFYGCAFNADNEILSVQKLRELAGRFAEVFVVGGIAELYSENELTALVGRDIRRVSLSECETLDPIIADAVPFTAIPQGNFSPSLPRHWSIQIGRGCESACSYCGDKKIVGSLRSVPIDKIIRQFEAGLDAGHQHFDLVGDDVGAWGADCGADICVLLEKLVSYHREYAISMQEVNIKYLIRHYNAFEKILDSGKINSMALAFQHVNDRVLSLMERGYDGSGVRGLAAMLKRQRVQMHFHAILGFPSETHTELMENLGFIAEQQFASGSYFLFQAKSYTPAHSLPGQKSKGERKVFAETAIRYLGAHGYAIHEHYPDLSQSGRELPDKLRLERSAA